MIEGAPEPPPRWVLRLRDFGRFLDLFAHTEATRQQRALNEAEEAGLVQFFQLSLQYGLQTLGMWLRANGTTLQTFAPLPIIREAAKVGLISDADVWSSAVERRNRMAHTYDPDGFRILVDDAGARFLPHLQALRAKLDGLAADA